MLVSVFHINTYMKKLVSKKRLFATTLRPLHIFFLGGFAAFVFGSLLLVALPVLADGYGLAATAGAANLITQRSPAEFAGQIIGAALSLVGVIFFILMIYSGIIWMSARGNDEQTKKSLHTITAAVIGLIIVLASYAITTFVFESIYGGELAPRRAPVAQDPNAGDPNAGDPDLGISDPVCGQDGWSEAECVDLTLDSQGCGFSMSIDVEQGRPEDVASIQSACDGNSDQCITGICGSPRTVCCLQ